MQGSDRDEPDAGTVRGVSAPGLLAWQARSALAADVVTLLDHLDYEEAARHSFFNFHAPGVSYLCLQRSPQYTAKLYVIEPRDGWVVAPHDHAYDFTTEVLAGEMWNVEFTKSANSKEAIDYFSWTFRSPMRGGDGFKRSGFQHLRHERKKLSAGDWYYWRVGQIHTIEVPRERAILFLRQGPDVVNTTWTYTIDGAAPSLDGLYRKPSPDDLRGLAIEVIAQICTPTEAPR